MAVLKPDLCIIGGTSAALTLARKVSEAGLSVVMVQRPRANLDFLPSKSILPLSFQGKDFDQARDHFATILDDMRRHNMPERLETPNLKVVVAYAKFVTPKAISIGDTMIEPRFTVISTGSSSAIPPIEGLDPDQFYTPETIFSMSHLPRSLVIYGGGSFAVEAADVFARLGSQVTVICDGPLLHNFDHDTVEQIRSNLRDKGVKIMERSVLYHVEHTFEGSVKLATNRDGILDVVEAAYLLITSDRKPSFDDMDLTKAGIETDDTGITTDNRLRTSAKRIFAIGPVAGWPLSVYPADQQDEVILKHIAYRSLFVRLASDITAKVMLTRPELASIGWSEEEATVKYKAKNIQTIMGRFERNDYAAAGGASSTGFFKLIVHRKGEILGVHIVHERAAELLAPWCVILREKIPLKNVANTSFPVPSLAEITRQAARDAQTATGHGLLSRVWIKLLRLLP